MRRDHDHDHVSAIRATIESIGATIDCMCIDTTGDGKVDAVDTTGDGHPDAFDSNGRQANPALLI